MKYPNGWLLIAVLFIPMFLAAFIVAGLSFRFHWVMLPKWAVIIGTVVFLLAYTMYAEVLFSAFEL